MDGTKKVSPTGVYWDIRNVEGGEGGETDGERGGRSVTQCGDSGLKRDLGRRSRTTRQQAQGRAVEASASGCLSRWTGNPIPENKYGNWVHKDKCISVSGWRIQGGVRTCRVMGKDPDYSW